MGIALHIRDKSNRRDFDATEIVSASFWTLARPQNP